MKICGNCHSENDSGVIFCFQCGVEIDKVESKDYSLKVKFDFWSITKYIIQFFFMLLVILSILVIFTTMYYEPSQETGVFTLINEELTITYRKITPNNTILISVDSLSITTNYFINISENQENTSLAWSVYKFAEVDEYYIEYQISSAIINCTSLTIELWEYHDIGYDFLLLDWIFIKV